MATVNNTQSRSKLIEKVQDKVLKSNAHQHKDTEEFIYNLNKQIELSLKDLRGQAEKLMSRPEYGEDGGLQFRKEKIDKLIDNVKKMGKEIEQMAKDKTLDHLMSSYGKQIATGCEIMEDVYSIHSSFATPSKAEVMEAINYPWSGKMWSDRVWTNTNKLTKELSGIIQRGAMTGETLQSMAKRISRDLLKAGNKYKYATERIVRTETARVQYVADTKVWEGYNVKKVRYVAFLDGKTSDICRERDGKIYELGKEPKLPAHPHCRSCYVPVSDIDGVMNNAKKKQEAYKKAKAEELKKAQELAKKKEEKKNTKHDVKYKLKEDEWGDTVIDILGEELRYKKSMDKYLKEFEKIEDVEGVKRLRDLLYDDDVDGTTYDVLAKMLKIKESNIRLSNYGYEYALTKDMAKDLGNGLNSIDLGSISEEENLGIRMYTGSHSSSMNFHFRRGDSVDDYTKGLIKGLDSVISKNKVQKDIVAFRGTSWGALDNRLIEIMMGDNYRDVIGSTVIDKGFMSTSIGQGSAFSGEGLSYEIKVPKGTNGVFVEDLTVSKGEYELILPRGTELKIVDVFRDEETMQFKLVMEVVK